MKIAYYSAGWCASGDSPIALGASDYWRLALPAEQLFMNGYDVVFARNLAACPDGSIAALDPAGDWHTDRDVIVMQRWMGDGTGDIIRRARATGQLIVNDLDDHYWALPRSNTARTFTDPALRPGYNRDHYHDALCASSLITVSTSYLAGLVERWGPPVRLVRNYIDLSVWQPRPPGEHVGWIGAISWRGADLEIVRRGVVPWLAAHDLSFYHGGDLPGNSSARSQLGYGNVVTRPAVPIGEYPGLWQPIRVALCPIETSSFGLAKSWVKGLEACARGVPFIASDHPEYRELGVGRLARKPRDWDRHLEELQDPDVFAAECAANRARAEELSISEHWHEWAHVLGEARSAATR